jgi:3-deoxy-D-manno-octulosonic-acid transferase
MQSWEMDVLMPHLLNLLYFLVLLLFSPWLLYKALTTGKYRRGLWTKFTGRIEHPLLSSTAKRQALVWFHGVSVGEIHLLRQVVAKFRQQRPDCACVISTTTDTGYDEAQKCFPDLPVILWPLDFTWAVQRALQIVRPSLVVLAEGELWPNFLLFAKRQGLPVAIINGRMSPRSCARYLKVRWLARKLFAHLDLIAAQTEEYAANYRLLGAANVNVTGNVKYDGVQTDRANPRTQALRHLLNIGPDDLVWVAGSTQAPEEEIALLIYHRLRAQFPRLRLLIVPRQKDRFEEVAQLLRRSGVSFLRRSELANDHPVPLSPSPPIILIDTIGELSALWGLADVAFVGGSLDGKRGGQNMIEPAAYGAAVLFGPHTWNFKETVTQLLRHGAALQIADADQLEQELHRLLTDPLLRTNLGSAARQFVLSQQGATAKTLDLLDILLPAPLTKFSREPSPHTTLSPNLGERVG